MFTNNKMYKVKIVRHAERLDYTSPLRWFFSFGQYWADTPLTNNGYVEAYNKGKQIVTDNFNPHKIYTSPYCRTISTASQIQKSTNNASIIIEPLISEYQQFWCHRTMIYPTGIPLIKYVDTTNNQINNFFEYPESHDKFSTRVSYALDYLFARNNTDFIIVSHGAFLTAFMSLYSIDNNISLPNFTYLSTITFMYDTVNQKILRSSIRVEV